MGRSFALSSSVHLGTGGLQVRKGMRDHALRVAGERVGKDIRDFDGSAAPEIHHQPLAGGGGKQFAVFTGIEPELAAGVPALETRRPRLGGHGLAAGEKTVHAQVEFGEHPGEIAPQQFLDAESQCHGVVFRGFLHAVEQRRQRQAPGVVQLVRLDFEGPVPVDVHCLALPGLML